MRRRALLARARAWLRRLRFLARGQERADLDAFLRELAAELDQERGPGA